MGQVNIKVGDAISLDGNDYFRVSKLGTESITVNEIPCFPGDTPREIPCTEIQKSHFVEVIKEEDIEICEHCGGISFNGTYCDVCHGDLFGGK
jgi:hypothetical protein